MRKSYIINSFLFLFIITIFAGLFSCKTTRKVKYFQDIPDSGKMALLLGTPFRAPTIQVDDILTILVETVDPQATATINMGNVPIQGSLTPSGISGLSQQQLPSSGYLVNKDGYVEIPVLGRIKLLGSTTDEAKAIIQTEANKFFKEPTVIVRYANFKFSVTGEVLKPGVYISPNEKVTVLDAIAQAGDLTIFGKRDNVLLLRENADGSKSPYRINLNKSEIFSSPYYYLRQNDILYIEPGKGKAAANDASQARTFALLGSLISVLIVVASRINL